jgi:hypothetical protein
MSAMSLVPVALLTVAPVMSHLLAAGFIQIHSVGMLLHTNRRIIEIVYLFCSVFEPRP